MRWASRVLVLLLAPLGALGLRRLEDLESGGRDVVPLDPDPLEAGERPFGGRTVQIDRLGDRVRLCSDGHEDPREIGLQLGLAGARDADRGGARRLLCRRRGRSPEGGAEHRDPHTARHRHRPVFTRVHSRVTVRCVRLS